MRSVKHPRAAIIFCLTLLCQHLTSSRDHLKSRLTMLPDLKPVTRICMSLDQLNRFFFISATGDDSHRVTFLSFYIDNVKDCRGQFSMIHAKHIFNHIILKRLCCCCFNLNCVCAAFLFIYVAKLLLMRKIGFTFLLKWICHFLSEGKMMIQED